MLVGCPAEKLGVPLPPRGLEAIDQEDLQRDMFQLLGPGGTERSPEAEAWVAQRLDEMHLDPVPVDIDGAVCGLREGRDDGVLLLLAPVTRTGASRAALPDAALITLAKSTDGLPRPRRGLLFCSAPLATGPEARRALPAHDELVTLSPLSELPPAGAPREDGMEAIDYVQVAIHLREVHQRILAPELTAPD